MIAVILPKPEANQMRVGVAIEVPEPYSKVLQGAREHCGDRLALLIPPHITLVGPTLIERDRVLELEDHLEAVSEKHQKFSLKLGGTDTFRPISPVVFVKVIGGSTQCDLLQTDLRQGLLSQDLRFPYHPHVTIAHEVSEPQLDVALKLMEEFQASFEVTNFSLYENGNDQVWRPIKKYALTD